MAAFPCPFCGNAKMADQLAKACEALKSTRVYVQDCIETGHDRTMLGNLYSARDEIDAALIVLISH